jgi:hypothetical protein
MIGVFLSSHSVDPKSGAGVRNEPQQPDGSTRHREVWNPRGQGTKGESEKKKSKGNLERDETDGRNL